MKEFFRPAPRTFARWILIALPGLSFFLPSRVGPVQAQAPAPTPTAEQAKFFEDKVRPILVENCYSCHGKDTQTAGLRVDNLASLLKGGSSGPALVPGNPDKSLLIDSVRQIGPVKMPAGGKLKPAEVQVLVDWVKMGAPWPEDKAPTTSGKGPLWSLQPVRMPSIPKVKNAKLVANPIDAFVLAKLESAGMTLSAPTDKRTLLRRVTYDLIGLPPSDAETEAFLADKSPTAYEKVVDRLLASPHYGERWGRLWLDVARYADTKGYVFDEDRNYPDAYTYRDWVINAFNRDLPYDQFIIDQLAADRLPGMTDADDNHDLAALGFLRVGRRFLNSQPDIIDDRIDVTMRGFQGFTVECARCHDHKFDPIPTQDYYSLYAVFSSSVEKEAPIGDRTSRTAWNAYEQKVDGLQDEMRKLTLSQTARLREMLKTPDTAANVPAAVKQTLQGIRENVAPEGDNLKKLFESFEKPAQDKYRELQGDLSSTEKAQPNRPEFAMAMMDGPNPHDGVVFKRGNPGNHGDAAPRRFLLALSKPGQERAHWTDGSGRLDLAKAIASKDNPLTARVFVNRVWQNHFGNGLVRTASDFGNQGDKPTHPELLDFLAQTFMNDGWSIKKLQKLIVMSATYRQVSDVTAKTFQNDPDNRYLSHMSRRRLDMEQMRDTFLSASGKIDLKDVGGKSVDIWSRPFSGRRSVYGFIERQNLPGVFRTFDFATPDVGSPKRFETTVPQQALFFMNSPFSVEQAKLVSTRPEIADAKDDGQRVRRLYLLLFDRLPSADEEAIGRQYLKQGSQVPMESPEGIWQYGYGSFDAVRARTGPFISLKVFDDKGYHVGDQFPDPNLGYIDLNQFGGHPGRDQQHAVIRRWVAPDSMTIHITGNITHRQAQGDGVRGRIVSSREGLLGEWKSHDNTVNAAVASATVQKGDTIDFILDPISNDGFDSFEWSPTILRTDGGSKWASRTEFGPPPPEPLSRLALYAQALMMTNEFMFID
ncbi:MAG: PSD1 domain-containing protein [Armatimonadetes bacterium]|nr:PSD1 domain-containing protein [Armatimonadota bacterium]